LATLGSDFYLASGFPKEVFITQDKIEDHILPTSSSALDLELNMLYFKASFHKQVFLSKG
jgi:hypothetical protein